MSLDSKISPNSVCVEWAGQVRKHLSIALRGAQTFTSIRENIEAFSAVQSVQHLCLRRGDTMDIFSADGLQIAYGVVCSRAEGAETWLDFGPSKIVSLEPAALYSFKNFEVRASGAQYEIFDAKLGRSADDVLWPTAKAAEVAIHQNLAVKRVA